MYNSLLEEIEGCPLNTGTKPLYKIEIIGRTAKKEEVW